MIQKEESLTGLRDALDVAHHGIDGMPDSRAKARLMSELEALRTEMDRWDTEPMPENAPDSIRRRVMSLLVISKV